LKQKLQYINDKSDHHAVSMATNQLQHGQSDLHSNNDLHSNSDIGSYFKDKQQEEKPSNDPKVLTLPNKETKPSEDHMVHIGISHYKNETTESKNSVSNALIGSLKYLV